MVKLKKLGRILIHTAICLGFYLIAAWMHQINPTIIDEPLVLVLCGILTVVGLAMAVLVLVVE